MEVSLLPWPDSSQPTLTLCSLEEANNAENATENKEDETQISENNEKPMENEEHKSQTGKDAENIGKTKEDEALIDNDNNSVVDLSKEQLQYHALLQSKWDNWKLKRSAQNRTQTNNDT